MIKGFIYNQQIEAQSTTCNTSGKSPVTITPVDGSSQGTALVLAGSAVAIPLDSPVAASEIARSNGNLTQAGPTVDVAPLGVALQKKNAMGPVITEAINALIAGGQYKAIIDRWQIPDGAITKSALKN